MANGERIITISPTTNKPLVEVFSPTEPKLNQILESSQRAFKSFSKTHDLKSRQSIVKKALEILESKKDVLARELTEQMGRPIAYTAKEILTSISRGEYMLKISDECLSDTPGEAEPGFKRYIRKEPIGPVLVILAWNFPYLILVCSLIPSILAGNTVILKPSPQTPTVADQIQSVFLEAGLPPDVITVFQSGSWSLLERAIKSPMVKLINFTGSYQGGIAVQTAASERIVPVFLELGGKDAAYVRADADIDWTADQLVDGSTFNSGQSCCSVERVYVHESIYEKFVEAVKKVLAGYKLGDPFDPTTQIGPVISKASKKNIEAHIEEAIRAGAVDATPENETFKNPPPDGNFVKPTLLLNVNHSMKIMTEETFGPVIPIMAVKNDEEAMKLINDSEYGLTGSIWTNDLERGEELALAIDAGTGFVNRAEFPSRDLAWTGWKNSGKGVTLGRFGFDQFVLLKSVHIKTPPS
ncbi:retinal dehydrogenase 2 [Phakopsora pachyrhizi]|uniref:Retinal dehydrogenase 2 n=1 Tax=Phakopsora pachyrhizi TaxID=170000 RepID=A0AAV0AX92_PHAPC|nr:retinal dehydrogenase 2 [Phakopsora pachyrhizi]CAH7676418.1 retinal dehydrogenase 2 [Phakopsora pachyrhizi]